MVNLFLALTLVWTPAAYAAQSKETASVLQVMDGETLLVQFPEQRRCVQIKLIGMQAPRKATREEDGQEPWGTRAQQYLSLKVIRKEVRIEYDVVVPAPDGKARWAYVWLGDTLLNEDMLRQGHAVLDTRPPNVKHSERLQAAQREAREKQRGIWNPKEPLPEPPSQFSANKKDSKETQRSLEDELSIPAYVKGCVIGNRKTKKFHVPGGRHYDTARNSANAIFFKTKEDAIKAGYTASSQ